MFQNAAYQSLMRMSTTSALLSEDNLHQRQPQVALEQRFATPERSDVKFRENGSEFFWFHQKRGIS
jgi:hypothetical protein